MAKRARFDRRYYDRFYGGPRERAAYRREEQRLGDFVCAYLRYLGQPVRRVIDIGCGLGQWREIVAKHFPWASYTGVEHSEYLCDELGWVRGSAVDFAAERPFDLVICKDTLQYLPSKAFRAAVSNLSTLCRGALYASILTTEDWRDVCDRRRTDDRVYLRSASWYRRILEPRFVNVGGGVFLSRESEAVPWELEKIGARAR
jgi:SAM-dependent methyltransferase